MVQSLQFWTLVAGLVAYVAKYYFPTLPLDATGILAGILFVLGLIGVVPQVRANQRGLAVGNIFASKALWILIVGLVGFVVRFYAPTFPYDDTVILGIVIFVLNQVGINPELRAKSLL